MTERVLVFDDAFEKLCVPLRAQFPDVIFDGVRTLADAVCRCENATAIVALAHDIDDEIVRRAPALRWIQALTTGTDHLRTLRSLRENVIVTSARGAMAEAVAEFAIMQMLALGRRLPQMLKHQRDKHWQFRMRGDSLFQRTAVVVGLGAIAEAFAVRAHAFGMSLIGVSDGRSVAPGFDEVVPRARLREAAARADYLVILAPLTEATLGLIDATVLDAMKERAFLINIARGGVVDQEALLNALRARTIAGAALDVFTPEPLPSSHPFWSLENVIISPHAAADTWDLYDRWLSLIAINLRAVRSNRPGDLVNRVSFATA